jgi:hypothetical protein
MTDFKMVAGFRKLNGAKVGVNSYLAETAVPTNDIYLEWTLVVLRMTAKKQGTLKKMPVDAPRH